MSGFDDDYIRHMNGSNDVLIPPPQGAPAVDISPDAVPEGATYTDKSGRKWDTRAVKWKSSLDVVALAQPQRLQITEWDDPQSPKFVARFNPMEFEAGVETEWNRFLTPGGSYAHMHFVGTRNYTVEFELYWVANTIDEAKEAEQARQILLGWCYPVATPDGWSLGPARLLVRWPENFKMMMYLVECRFKHLKFALSGKTVRWAATLKFEEASDAFIGAAEVRANSVIRGLEGRPVVTSGKLGAATPPKLNYNSAQTTKKAMRQHGQGGPHGKGGRR